MSAEADTVKLGPAVKMAIEIGPLVAFFLANARAGIFCRHRGLHGGGGAGARRQLVADPAGRAPADRHFGLRRWCSGCSRWRCRTTCSSR